MRTSASILCFLFLLFSAWLAPTFAKKQSYVVYLGSHERERDIEFSTVEYDRAADSHYTLLGSFLGSKEKAQEAIFYSYTRHINGFAAVLDEAEVDQISRHPDVISVFLNQPRKLHTTRSWDFLGLEHDGQIQESWTKARFGEDTIIANLDTGVWPESKSFSDEGFGPIPPKWKGTCQNGQDPTFKCNRKLIGARFFNKGYLSAVKNYLNSSVFDSPRDNEGHGTHTLSTAGGNFVPGVSLFGLGNGTAKGGSPKARVAAYKVCGPELAFFGSCFDADILAGFDMAIYDGVDVISVSLGGGAHNYYEDSIAIGSFHAVKHGILVVCSAGNEGPGSATLSNVAPWQITVGASTMDRKVASRVILGNNITLTGESFSDKKLPNNTFFPLVTATSVKAANASDSQASACMEGSLDPVRVKGKIVVCMLGDVGPMEKGITAALAGAVGMVIANDVYEGDQVYGEAHILPAVHISYTDGAALIAYINSTGNPVAYITPPSTLLGMKPAPVMATFSSRGPSTITPEILKPDITAPGVNVIAAYTEAHGPAGKTDTRRTPYFFDTGTSMSCPHVSGIVSLLKTLHPDWSPAAIKSSIMTTARTRDNVAERITAGSHIKGTPFSYGSGLIRPNLAMDPGLVYDLTYQDYLTFLCSLGYNQANIMLFTNSPFTCPKPISLVNLNYPSIAVPFLNGSITVTRTVKNVGSSPATYNASVINPPGLSIDVQPKTLTFATIGEQKTFNVTITATKLGAARDYVFGTLTWSDGKHSVRSQIAVKAKN